MRRILSVRARKSDQSSDHKFEIPKINLSAEDYVDRITMWSNRITLDTTSIRRRLARLHRRKFAPSCTYLRLSLSHPGSGEVCESSH
ncbi:hypothetical protein AVEN_260816-1 [Araneus ventricosus]|uniref:Uncharacterized protein n=1 Tax=Araneus ventricosus TaxID=182803 RepID=A0A4Y2FBS0_ARAVE|nr:hypothetical protein AVEN_260816-1 [Araneus ventricosus]